MILNLLNLMKIYPLFYTWKLFTVFVNYAWTVHRNSEFKRFIMTIWMFYYVNLDCLYLISTSLPLWSLKYFSKSVFNSGFDSFIQKCVIMFHKEENKEKIEEETSTQNKKKIIWKSCVYVFLAFPTVAEWGKFLLTGRFLMACIWVWAQIEPNWVRIDQ